MPAPLAACPALALALAALALALAAGVALTAFQPKLANLLFTYELQRRLMRHGSTIAVAAHPGVADTELLGTKVLSQIRPSWQNADGRRRS